MSIFYDFKDFKDFKEVLDFIRYFAKCARVLLCLSTAGLTLGKFC
ncbi:hypothetical protein HAL07_15240 [Helicobacter ailurogastricus]|uniref:Uncharacterized protein n=1 Tax=Helicobacter ailurogastricus TaxID=1578720 RepID=A0A0K2X6Z6_9HELI|nr:hypothetical protein HAL011_02480 [Helicobacter ailurogastricus]CRF42781.1 hypothetical protein HAL013_09890 [Helicobacter ailurogastricus]CRF44837.1 hypothetical protein HAL09_14520 [Helicobacter ailurogastricus]CRF53059.1 hypothetical protein HAL07_15240 [Helicobacter ailurogastricus]